MALRSEVEAGMDAMSSAMQSAAEHMVRGLANGVSYIALEEWTMQARARAWRGAAFERGNEAAE
jgi:hypothetical protein